MKEKGIYPRAPEPVFEKILIFSKVENINKVTNDSVKADTEFFTYIVTYIWL